MPRSPSIVPHGVDHDIYLVLNDFGRLGRAWCETDEEGTDRETLIRRLLEDQYSHPSGADRRLQYRRGLVARRYRRHRRRAAPFAFPEYDEVPRSVQAFLEPAGRR
jgi:hypothetical protein